MADKKITELSQLGLAESADLFVLADVSAYETKNITVSNLMGSPGPIGANNADSGKFTTLQLLNGVSINEISSDITLGGNSNLAVPTEKAIKSYVDLSVGASNDIVVRVSSDSTAVAHNVLLVDTTTGDINIKMFDTSNGRITIKKISNDLNRVIITSTKNIDGLSHYIINTPNQSYNFLVDSGDFFVI